MTSLHSASFPASTAGLGIGRIGRFGRIDRIDRVRRASTRWIALAIATALVGALAPASAQASPETLKRSVGNMVQAPLDLALSPFVAFATLNRNVRDIDDTTAVRIAYYLPGYVWLLGLQVGSSAIRGITGALEFLPGLILLPFDADLDPLFDPVERGEGLVEWENPVMDVKFGINYQAPAF